MYNFIGDFVKLFLQGMLLGLAKIMPGVSGSLLAVNLGLYDRAIESISHFFKDVKLNGMFLLNVGVGICTSIILFSGVLNYFYVNYYCFTVSFFTGLLCGNISQIKKNVYFNKKNIIYFILIIFFLLLLYNLKRLDIYVYKNNIKNDLYVFLLGMIDAFSMILPGISGSAIFMILGCYSFVLTMFSSLYDISLFLNNFKVLIIFFVGIGTGVFIISNLFLYLLKNFRSKVYFFIFSCACSSVCLLLSSFISKTNSFIEFIFEFLLLFLGIVISKCTNN